MQCKCCKKYGHEEVECRKKNSANGNTGARGQETNAGNDSLQDPPVQPVATPLVPPVTEDAPVISMASHTLQLTFSSQNPLGTRNAFDLLGEHGEDMIPPHQW